MAVVDVGVIFNTHYINPGTKCHTQELETLPHKYIPERKFSSSVTV